MGIKEVIIGRKEFCVDCGIKIMISSGMMGNPSTITKAIEYKEGYRCEICDKKHRETLTHNPKR